MRFNAGEWREPLPKYIPVFFDNSYKENHDRGRGVLISLLNDFALACKVGLVNWNE